MNRTFFSFVFIIANVAGFNSGNLNLGNNKNRQCAKLFSLDRKCIVNESAEVAGENNVNKNIASRRQFLSFTAAVGSFLCNPLVSIPANADTVPSAESMIKDLERCAELLKPIPDLLQAEKWDEVRNILKSPPVNFLWNMGEGRNTLNVLAKSTGEFGLIDLKDELSISLQMCDQETYGNVFIYYQPGNGKIKIKEPTDLVKKAMVQLDEAIVMAKDASK